MHVQSTLACLPAYGRVQASAGTLAGCPEAVAAFLDSLSAGLRPLVRSGPLFDAPARGALACGRVSNAPALRHPHALCLDAWLIPSFRMYRRGSEARSRVARKERAATYSN